MLTRVYSRLDTFDDHFDFPWNTRRKENQFLIAVEYCVKQREIFR